MTTMVLHVVTLACVAVFGLAVIARYIKYAKMPIHLRWELYPVAHEKGAAHGGSYLEQTDWWTKPRETSLFNELKDFIPELLFLKALYHHNRPLWYRSFPFHFGLYLSAGFGALVVLSAILGAAGVNIGATLGKIVLYLSMGLGWGGIVLALFGALGLLQRRLTDPELKDYTSPAAIFNLVLFIATYGVLLAIAIQEPKLSVFHGYAASLFSFADAPMGVLPFVGILMCVVMMAYIPLTHMAHFFLKWFTWHKIRWDDEPNMVGSKIEKRVQAALAQKPTWAAAHIKADGNKNWVDIATEELD